MKMISSTSITSMYGTTLMSALSFLRLRWRVIVAVIRELLRLGGTSGVGRSLLDVRLALQDRGELLGETLVTHGQPLDAGGEAVVGPHRRDRDEQAHRGREQRLRDARRDRGDRCLLVGREAVHRHHDAEHGADEADVRRGGTEVREQLQVVLEAVDLARERRPHRALRAFELRARVDALLLPQAREFAEAGLEDRLEPRDDAVAV